MKLRHFCLHGENPRWLNRVHAIVEALVCLALLPVAWLVLFLWSVAIGLWTAVLDASSAVYGASDETWVTICAWWNYKP